MSTIVIKSIGYTYTFLSNISIAPLQEVTIHVASLTTKDILKLKSFIGSKVHVSNTDLEKLDTSTGSSSTDLEETKIEEIPTINAVPLYTLNNEGSYVLTTPDVWLKNGEYYIPAYKANTLGV